jgi:hypothetical protein
MSSNRLTIVCAADIENEAGKEKKRMGCKKQEEKKENRTECDSNELTIYNEEKKKIDDRSYACMFVALCVFKHIEEEERRKRQNIDFNIISSLYIEYP